MNRPKTAITCYLAICLIANGCTCLQQSPTSSKGTVFIGDGTTLKLDEYTENLMNAFQAS